MALPSFSGSVMAATTRQWRLEVAGDGYSRIVSRHSGKCLDVNGGSLERWRFHHSVAVSWRRQPAVASRGRWRRLLADCLAAQRQVPGCERRIAQTMALPSFSGSVMAATTSSGACSGDRRLHMCGRPGFFSGHSPHASSSLLMAEADNLTVEHGAMRANRGRGLSCGGTANS